MSDDPLWPTTLPQRPVFGNWRGAPKDDRRIFEPDIGPIQTAPRTTAKTGMFQGAFAPLTTQQLIILENFYNNDLKQGSLPFRWRDPLTNLMHRWLFETPYSFNNEAYEWNEISFSFIRLPGGPITIEVWTADATITIDTVGYRTDGSMPL